MLWYWLLLGAPVAFGSHPKVQEAEEMAAAALNRNGCRYVPLAGTETALVPAGRCPQSTRLSRVTVCSVREPQLVPRELHLFPQRRLPTSHLPPRRSAFLYHFFSWLWNWHGLHLRLDKLESLLLLFASSASFLAVRSSPSSELSGASSSSFATALLACLRPSLQVPSAFSRTSWSLSGKQASFPLPKAYCADLVAGYLRHNAM